MIREGEKNVKRKINNNKQREGKILIIKVVKQTTATEMHRHVHVCFDAKSVALHLCCYSSNLHCSFISSLLQNTFVLLFIIKE